MTIGGYMIERGFGLAPPAHAKAQDQLQKSYPTVGIQSMPNGSPTDAISGTTVGIDPACERFVVLGDSGGIVNGQPQLYVAQALVQHLVDDPTVGFAYHIGDEVYFHGEASHYAAQFYEPYAHFNRPIVGIPGNHDGDVATDDLGVLTGRLPLDTFMSNFCDAKPNVPTSDPQFEYGRHTQTQPYCYWTLGLDKVTVIGLYSNVPSGGHIDSTQEEWLVRQLQKAPADIPLIVTLHHPPFSVDAHHGGSVRMGVVLDRAFDTAGRWPNAVIAGHVHDYQRFTRVVNDRVITYVVIGNSGYHNLHPLAGNAHPGMMLPVKSDYHDDAVSFEYGDAHNYGYMVWEVANGKLAGNYYPVTKMGTASVAPIDAFVAGER